MKRILNFLILAITILCVNLVTGYITDYFMNYKRITSPIKFTAIGMIVLVAIFYPVFEFMEKKIADFVRKTIVKGSHVFGKFMGIILIFIFIFFALFSVYANLWFNLNVPAMLWAKLK